MFLVSDTNSESTGNLNGRHEFVELRAWKPPEEFGLVVGRKGRHIGFEYHRHRSELRFRKGGLIGCHLVGSSRQNFIEISIYSRGTNSGEGGDCGSFSTLHHAEFVSVCFSSHYVSRACLRPKLRPTFVT